MKGKDGTKMLNMIGKKVLARPLAILVAVLVAFTFMPMLPGGAGNENAAYAASGTPLSSNYLQITIAGDSVWQNLAVSDVGDGWSWNHSTRTLTLSEDFGLLTETTDAHWIDINSNAPQDDIKIELSGDVSIRSNTDHSYVIGSNTDLDIDLNGCEFYVASTNSKMPLALLTANGNYPNLNIIDSKGSEGTGRLDLISTTEGTYNPGFWVDGITTIDVGSSRVFIESGCNTLAAVLASKGFVLESGDVNVYNGHGQGILSGGVIIINGGKLEVGAPVTAPSIKTSTADYGLIVNGGYLNADSGQKIEVGTVVINGGHLATAQPIVTFPDNAKAYKALSGGGFLETRAPNTIGSFTFTDGIFDYNDEGDHEITVRGSSSVLPVNLYVGEHDTLLIETGATLTVPFGVTLTVEGQMNNHGTLINDGNIDVTGSNGVGGSIKNYDGNKDDVSGTIINNGVISISDQFVGNPAFIDNGSYEHQNGVFQNYGDITNGGAIFNTYGEITNSGTLTNESGAFISNYGGEINNSGVLTNENGADIYNTSGEIINSGTLTNESGGSIDNSDGEIINSGTLTNENGASIDNTDGAIYNGGTFNPGGSITGYLPTDTNFASVAVVASIPAYTYTGKAITPAVTLTAPAGITSADYTVEYANNVNAGTASVTVKGKGKYGGSKTAAFTINPANLSTASVAAIADQVYNNKVKKPAFTVVHGGVTLAANTHYTVTHSSRKEVGKATITIKGKGNYTGTKAVTFKIVPAKTSVKKAAAGEKTLTITWKKISGATKYQIQYRVKGTSTWKTASASAKSTTLTIKKLKTGKAYQIRIRAQQTIKSGEHKGTYYAPYSAVKTSAKVK
jgi:hypothetical protein